MLFKKLKGTWKLTKFNSIESHSYISGETFSKAKFLENNLLKTIEITNSYSPNNSNYKADTISSINYFYQIEFKDQDIYGNINTSTWNLQGNKVILKNEWIHCRGSLVSLMINEYISNIKLQNNNLMILKSENYNSSKAASESNEWEMVFEKQ